MTQFSLTLVSCAIKPPKLNQSKKKRPIRTTSSKKDWEKSKVFSNNIKHFRMIKVKVKIEIIFKMKTKKMTAEAVKKKNIAPEGDSQSHRLRARIRWKVNTSKTLLKKRSNVTTAKSWNIMLTTVLNPTINNRKTSKNNKNTFTSFVSFQQKNIRFSFNYKNNNKRKCFIHNNKNFDLFWNDYQFRFSVANQETRKFQKRIKWTLNIDFKWTAFTNVSTTWSWNKHDK